MKNIEDCKGCQVFDNKEPWICEFLGKWVCKFHIDSSEFDIDRADDEYGI